MATTYKYCVVGAGVCGLLAAALLTDEQLAETCIIDKSFFGGDLMERWSSVKSNTTIKQIIDAINKIPRWNYLLVPVLHEYEETQIIELRKIAKAIKILAKPILEKTTRIIGSVSEVRFDKNDKACTIRLDNDKSIQAEHVIICTGVKEKILDYPLPSIPLDVALDAKRLADVVKKGDSVMVFGTNHSGCLAIHNLGLYCSRVYAVHKNESPFLYDRDGHYGGIKKEAAEIADNIVAGKLPCKLLQLSDSENIHRIMHHCEYLVYCTGFEQKKNLQVLINGFIFPLNRYDSETARLSDVNVPIWCYGAGFPNHNDVDGKRFYDVGIPSFVEYMLKTFPTLI